MKKEVLLGLVGVAVFLAGCIALPVVTPVAPKGIASGVAIKSFYAVNPEIYSGDEAYFGFTLENIGEADATGVKAKLYGLGTDWTITKDTKSLGDLTKSSPTEKLPGGTIYDEFPATSPPKLPVDNTYTAYIRVTYGYTTSAVGRIKLYSKSYLNAMPIEESRKIRASSGIESFVVTKGPIQLSLTGLARPLEDGVGERSVTLAIENVGQGGAYYNTPGDRKVKILRFNVNNQPCPLPTQDGVVELPRVGSKIIRCSFELPGVEEFKTLPVEVGVGYNYYVDASTSIKVLKIPA